MTSRTALANAVRALSMDAVEQARSGHPGMPMGMADVAEVLWNDFLRHNPANPGWPDRDRFVLSNGHGSMLLYALLHLSGYDLPMDEIRRFRQLGSRTPGHPERGRTPGVETTTGPLGQGLANAVGMAIAEQALAARYNRGDHRIFDHHTYVFAGDGCLMEGISHEACSLAGTLGLGKLVVVYDDNGISIDGPVSGWFTEDVPARFAAYGWHVVPGVDGHDPEAVREAIAAARAEGGRPSLVCCRTVIGFGAPRKAGTAASHGAPLGAEEVAAARERLGWPHPPFEIPDEIYAGWDARERGARAEAEWRERHAAWAAEHPDLAAELGRRLAGALPEGWGARSAERLAAAQAAGASVATRKASQQALETLGPDLPELVGGSADLTGSNLTEWSGSRVVGRERRDGNYLHFGVREFAMFAIGNGLALHGGFVPYVGTFLMFSEYARNAIRMAAMMEVAPIYVLTHDSIGLGEDGPTHQAVEQAATLRLVPRLSVWRPCDAVETLAAWQAALERRDAPTALLLSRQTLPHQDRTPAQVEGIRRGGYVLVEGGEHPDVALVATGSEVALAVEAARRLAAEGIAARVVSLPSTDVFEAQDAAYRDSVLPPSLARRLVIEAGATGGWHRYAGDRGEILGIDAYGESAPAPVVFEHFGLTVDEVVRRARALAGARDDAPRP